MSPKKDKKEDEEPAGRIYNTVMPEAEAVEETPRKEEKVETKPKAPSAEDEDDWSAVPAFLRRGKK